MIKYCTEYNFNCFYTDFLILKNSTCGENLVHPTEKSWHICSTTETPKIRPPIAADFELKFRKDRKSVTFMFYYVFIISAHALIQTLFQFTTDEVTHPTCLGGMCWRGPCAVFRSFINESKKNECNTGWR